MMTLCARSGDHRSRILRVELPMTYPPTAKGDVVETLHGVAVPDPYRPLEDANSPETKAWVEAQNALSGSYLKAIPERERIVEGLTKLWNFERFSGVERAGEKVFYYRNDGLQNQSALYVTDDPAKDGRVLLDPNLLSDDGTVALGGTSITRDGRLLAYALSVGGSDWHTWRVRDVATGEDLPDVIAWSKFSGASWDHDGAGFYYSAYDAPKPGEALQEANYDQKLYYHRLGTPQGDDLLVYARPDRPEWGFGGEVTEDGRFLVVTVWHGTQRENRVFLRDLRAEGAEVEPLLDEADASYAFLGNDGDRLLFRTDKDAPTGRIVAVRKGGEMETVVPAEGQAIQSAAMAGGSLFVTRLEDATSAVAQYDLQGTPIRKVELPGLGTARVGGAYADEKDLFYTYTSYTSPPTVYRLDVETGASKPFRTPEVAFDAAAYETRRLFYASKDGTRIPPLRHLPQGADARRREPDPAVRLRRLQHLDDSGLLLLRRRVAGDGRRLRRRLHPGRRRVREGVARRRTAEEQAELLRRLYRRRGVPHRRGLHLDAEARLPGRLERRPPRRRGREPAPRSLGRRASRGRRHGPPPLP